MYKRQQQNIATLPATTTPVSIQSVNNGTTGSNGPCVNCACLLYTSDAADERSSVDLGGRRIIKKKNNKTNMRW